MYRDEHCSLRTIASRTGIGRGRVTTLLRQAGVTIAYKGTGRRRPLRADDDPGLPEILVNLYLNQRLTTQQISERTGIPAPRVRARLHRYGIATRTRGRCNREDRQEIPREVLRELYVERGLRAVDVAAILDTSANVVLRAAHDHGLAVRHGGIEADTGPGEISLIESLYADPGVLEVLRNHDVPHVPASGRITERFPKPVHLTPSLVSQLYHDCGLACSHIELLTGNPALTVSRYLAACGIPLRPPGGRCPFRKAWYTANEP